MVAAAQKAKEAFECPYCMAPLRPGSAACKACNLAVPRPLNFRAIQAFVAMVLVLALMVAVQFVFAPNMLANQAIALVRSQESAFVEQAMQTIREKQFRFLGWDTQVFGKQLVLVTFTYQDTSAGQGGYLAVWWAVNLEKGTSSRVKSMQDFADNHLLKID